MLQWRIEPIVLPLRYAWAISRNTSASKTNLIVYCFDEIMEAAGEAAPNIRYNETPELLISSFENIKPKLPQNADVSVEGLEKLLAENNLPNALRFAIESAFVHYLCKLRKINVNHFFGLPYMEKVRTAYSLPIMPVEIIGKFISDFKLNRFHILKIKINSVQGLDLINEVSKNSKRPLLIDANESFKNADDVLAFARQLNPYDILLLEQPLPSHKTDDYIYLKEKIPYALFADESMTSAEDISELQKQFHGVNMKLMKAGGYLRGIKQLKQAQTLGLKTMLGCMVETSLGISSALHISGLAEIHDLDGFLIPEKDPFELLMETGGEIVRKTLK